MQFIAYVDLLGTVEAEEDMEVALALVALLILAAVGAALAWFLLSQPKPFLDKSRKKITIVDVKELSQDTKRLRLDLGSSRTPLGLPIGKHIKIHAPNPESARTKGTWNGKPDKESQAEIARSYTPATSSAVGFVDLVIKVYRPGKYTMPDGKEVTWEDGGKMSLHLDSKKAGDTIEISGPVGANEYIGPGQFKVPGNVIEAKHIGLMAGGSGITPILQVVSAALANPKDTTKFSLIYANKTENDILCRDIIEEMESRSSGRFKAHYTLDFPPENWKGKNGFITTDMIKECLPDVNLKPIILMCGPPPMIEFACKKNLETLGYAKHLQVAF